jgi:hypothetical protein
MEGFKPPTKQSGGFHEKKYAPYRDRDISVLLYRRLWG